VAQAQTDTEPLILVVDDDPGLASTLQTALAASGYRVVLAGSGAEARAALLRLQPELILLDLMLPDTDGLILASTFKRLQSTSIIIMSARTQQVDRVLGLKLGADDFIAKPFELEELLARVEAVLRRATPAVASTPAATDHIRIGELFIAPSRALVTLGAVPVHLTPIEYRLLLALAESANAMVSRQALMQLVWGYDDASAGHMLDVHLGRLRQKIRGASLTTPTITTVRGAGFKLVYEPSAAPHTH
jgi:DNA-binding response OmpR family regulator